MADVPARQEIHIHPTDLRSLADKIYLEVETNVQPQAKAILARLGHGEDLDRGFDAGNYRVIGQSGIAYSGTGAGDRFAENVAAIAKWVEAYRNGMTSLATGLAVTSEESATSDGLNAVELNNAFTTDSTHPN